jgi:hypothetical protein
MRKGYVLLLAAAALLVLLAGLGLLNGLWGQKNGPAAATPTQTAIPAALGGLPLVETITGDAGVAQTNRLHGLDVGLDRGYVAQYAGSGSRATMWVGWAESEAAAQALVDRMTAKIGPGHPIFQDLQALSFGQRTVFAATGQGQQHFYFHSGSAVVWIAVDGAVAPDVMHDALRSFP